MIKNQSQYLFIFLISFIIENSYAQFQTQGLSTLIVGDSQGYGPFGELLARKIEGLNQECRTILTETNPLARWWISLVPVGQELPQNYVTQLAVSGSSPHHWSALAGDPQFSRVDSSWQSWILGQLMKKNETNHRSQVLSSRSNPFYRLTREENSSLIEAVVKEINPQLVVFQFLGNSVGFYEQSLSLSSSRQEPYLNNTIKRHLENLLAVTLNPHHPRKCLFITSSPLEIKNSTQNRKNQRRQETQNLMENYIRQINPSCEIIKGISEDSIALISGNSRHFVGDGVHLSRLGAQVFVDYLTPSLCESFHRLQR
jgi:lysophospholipase L1-like esterase